MPVSGMQAVLGKGVRVWPSSPLACRGVDDARGEAALGARTGVSVARPCGGLVEQLTVNRRLGSAKSRHNDTGQIVDLVWCLAGSSVKRVWPMANRCVGD